MGYRQQASDLEKIYDLEDPQSQSKVADSEFRVLAESILKLLIRSLLKALRS